MRNALLRFSPPPAIPIFKRLYVVALILLAAASPAPAQGKQQTISGYAEYYKNGVLIVEGQRIVADQSTVFKKVPSLGGTPLGFEVKVKGVRQPDGTFLAKQLEAKPNGIADFEPLVLARADAGENFFVSKGVAVQPGPGGELMVVGRVIADGPGVERARNIMARLLPSYVRPDRIRVRLIENEGWNAMAMANGAVWVFTGLLRDMSDDEVAIVLGHELAHFTYEHMRKRERQQAWINLAAAIAGNTTNNPTAQQLIVTGLLAWKNGYSREHEDQADRVGLRYAYEAGFDVEKGSRMWLRTLEKDGEPDKLMNLIHGSHSRPSERYANLHNEIGLNYAPAPMRPAQPAVELAGAGGATGGTDAAVGLQTLAPPAPAVVPPLSVGRGPEALLSSAGPRPAPAVASPRPLPAHVVRDAAGKLLPASGYQWVNPADPNDLHVRLMPGLVDTGDGKLRPVNGYQWVNPVDPKDFRVKLMPGLIKTGDGFRPDKGYGWVNPSDLNDIRVEPIPQAGPE